MKLREMQQRYLNREVMERGAWVLAWVVMSRKNRKWYAFIIFIFLGISGAICLLLKNSSQKKAQTSSRITKGDAYFVPLQIRGYSSLGIPYVEVMVENKPVIAEIDLGYGGVVSLPPHIVKEFNKKTFIERTRTCGIRGKIYEKNAYQVERVEIHNLSFFCVPIEEKNLECEHDALIIGEPEPAERGFGKIGWHLFANFNLLIDCKHSTLAICDGLDSLKQQGYPVDSFKETSFSLEDGFIGFEVITDAGALHCILDTGATWNLLNRDLETGCNDHMIFMGKKLKDILLLNPENKDLFSFDLDNPKTFSSFKIGGSEFGPLTCGLVKSPLPIDVVLGMEFVDSMLIFIDFANRKIYFHPYPQDEKK